MFKTALIIYALFFAQGTLYAADAALGVYTFTTAFGPVKLTIDQNNGTNYQGVDVDGKVLTGVKQGSEICITAMDPTPDFPYGVFCTPITKATKNGYVVLTSVNKAASPTEYQNFLLKSTVTKAPIK